MQPLPLRLLSKKLKESGCTVLKVQTCQAFEMCTREASQCMGGISYVRSGQGRKLESLLRSVRAFVIFAGSEEVMLDLGARQMVRLQKSLQDAGPAPASASAPVSAKL